MHLTQFSHLHLDQNTPCIFLLWIQGAKAAGHIMMTSMKFLSFDGVIIVAWYLALSLLCPGFQDTTSMLRS